MTFNNLLYSGFIFHEDEELLKYKFKMMNSILLIISFFPALFGVLSDLGINDIGEIHSKVNYVYSLLTIGLIFFLRRSKRNFSMATNLLLFFSVLTFTSALLFVPQDEFRIIWFFLLVFVAYALGGLRHGRTVTIISILIILASNYFTDLQLSSVAVNSAVLALVIGDLLFRFYSQKIVDYEASLKEKNAALQAHASTDELTGAANRRVFNEVFERYFDTAKRGKKELTLMMLDLDLFKDINDTYGHQTGDLILVEFSHAIQAILRKSDLFARIGGEEFAVILLGTDIKGASVLAEKIHAQINAISLRCDRNKDEVCVTTSIGISHYLPTDKSYNDIFARADNALYQAKDRGRDQTCILA